MILRKEGLTRAVEAVIAAGGSEPREARLVAENLVTANLLGHDSHGIGMVPRYIDALLEGGLAANQHPKATMDAGALLALDGCKGYGQTIGHASMEMAIERAKKHGSCVMVLANSHHLGRIAQGKMRVAHNKREKVSPGLLIDDQGRPTDDPRYAVVPPLGAILAFGGHKGYGLAVACELLGGALTGGGTWHYDESKKQRVLNGMLAVLIDPVRLGTADAFGSEARQFLDWLRKGRPAADADKVRIAGEPEREIRAKRERDGISVDDNTWKEILAAGAKVKLDAARIEKLARG
jgi:hydroxycarboxylate dehydrogenase B